MLYVSWIMDKGWARPTEGRRQQHLPRCVHSTNVYWKFRKGHRERAAFMRRSQVMRQQQTPLGRDGLKPLSLRFHSQFLCFAAGPGRSSALLPRRPSGQRSRLRVCNDHIRKKGPWQIMRDFLKPPRRNDPCHFHSHFIGQSKT